MPTVLIWCRFCKLENRADISVMRFSQDRTVELPTVRCGKCKRKFDETDLRSALLPAKPGSWKGR